MSRWSLTRRQLRWAPIVVALLISGPCVVRTLVTEEPIRYRASTISGDLAEYVNDFVGRNPDRDGRGYEVPSSRDARTMVEAWTALRRGDLPAAAELAGPLGYEVVRFTDTLSSRVVMLLRERELSNGEWARGWGLYGWAPSLSEPVVVEVPHAVADLDTEDVGVGTFRAAKARALLVAGAHRAAGVGESADVAHRTDSVFHAIHQATVAADIVIVQPHGFADSTMAEDAVVSSGDRPSRMTTAVAASLKAAGFQACVYDGNACTELAGTANVQGIHARTEGAEFVHLEISNRIRTDVVLRDRLVAAVASALRDATE